MFSSDLAPRIKLMGDGLGTERDLPGELPVPDSDLYGIHTAAARPAYPAHTGRVENFMSDKGPVELAICMGSSCFSRGNKRNIQVIKDYIEHHGLSGKVSLKGHLCEGLCKDGPNMAVDDQVFSALDSDLLEFILDQQLTPQE